MSVVPCIHVMSSILNYRISIRTSWKQVSSQHIGLDYCNFVSWQKSPVLFFYVCLAMEALLIQYCNFQTLWQVSCPSVSNILCDFRHKDSNCLPAPLKEFSINRSLDNCLYLQCTSTPNRPFLISQSSSCLLVIFPNLSLLLYLDF